MPENVDFETIERLRAALQLQWEFNHSEHCRNEWPHPGKTCHWAPPPELGWYAGEDWYRPYLHGVG